jgi:hypothetical protein
LCFCFGEYAKEIWPDRWGESLYSAGCSIIPIRQSAFSVQAFFKTNEILKVWNGNPSTGVSTKSWLISNLTFPDFRLPSFTSKNKTPSKIPLILKISPVKELAFYFTNMHYFPPDQLYKVMLMLPVLWEELC